MTAFVLPCKNYTCACYVCKSSSKATGVPYPEDCLTSCVILMHRRKAGASLVEINEGITKN